MSSNSEQVVRVGDRTFTAPRVCEFAASNASEDHPPTWQLSARVDIVEGRPMFRRVELVCHAPMAPIDLQRFPWGKAAEWAIERNATDAEGHSGYAEVRRARQRDAAAARARARSKRITRDGSGRERARVTPELLREVVAIRNAARAEGRRAWAAEASAALGYSTVYVRQLASRADRELE